MLEAFASPSAVISVELQAEPWFPSGVSDLPWQEQLQHMSKDIFLQNVDYARAVGFAENYFWGVEWWYYEKELKKDDSIWQEAKKLFSE